MPRSEDESCALIYDKGTQIVVETILDAHELVPECASAGAGQVSFLVAPARYCCFRLVVGRNQKAGVYFRE